MGSALGAQGGPQGTQGPPQGVKWSLRLYPQTSFLLIFLWKYYYFHKIQGSPLTESEPSSLNVPGSLAYSIKEEMKMNEMRGKGAL